METKKHGGKRAGAGRKSKAEEQKLIEKLTPLDDKAFKSLEQGIEDNQSWAVKMYFEYMYGKPKETKDITINEVQPLFWSDESE
jgi:hypothetical protein